MVEAGFVTPHGRRPIPADMLLLQERRRRLAQAPGPLASVDPAISIAGPRSAYAAAPFTEDIVAADEDQLMDDESLAVRASAVLASGDVVLRRPISQVSLATLSWSGPIDHDSLQSALACHPVRTSNAASHPSLAAAAPFPPEHGGPALEVVVRAGDLAALAAMASSARARAAALLLAARLPDRLTGLEAASAAAVSAVLAAYRRSSLIYAWYGFLSGAENVQAHRERDEAAVAVLSTLRALLGER